MNDKYTFNKDLFKEWSNKMAYMLGWISADGCIEYIKNTRYMLAFDLAEKEPLKMFKEILSADHPIHEHNRKSTTYTLQLRDKEFVEDIMNYGITPDKTFNIEVPDIPNKYINHYIRGLFEGDGSVYLLDRPNNRKQLNTKITSASKKLIEQIGDILKEEIRLIPKIYEYSPDNRDNTYYNLRYGGKESYKLYKYMYKNAKYYLKRKKDVFEKAREIKAGIGLTNCKRCGKEMVRLSANHKWCDDCKPIVKRKQWRGEKIKTIDE